MKTIKLLDEKTVKSKVDTAEKILNECFDILYGFIHHGENFHAIVYDFQSMLADCLYNLMSFYQELSKEQKQLITAKKEFNEKEFSKLMERNALFSQAIKNTIELGKSLGDAFAWFFFRNNRSELDKHLDHKPTGLYVHDIGGLGELEFIKNNKFIGGRFVLYHSITTMLRIGDFSLYDAHLGIVGVGELKTQCNGDKLKISTNLTTKINLFIEGAQQIPDNCFESHVQKLQVTFPTLSKQLSMHHELIKNETYTQSSKVSPVYEHNLLNQITENNALVFNYDKSLLLFAKYSQFDDIFSIFLHDKKYIDIPDTVVENQKHLLTYYNDLDLLSLHHISTQINPMSVPILWWDVNKKTCRDIYFEKVSLYTIFNPAKLLMHFVDDGFNVQLAQEIKNIKITKQVQDSEIKIEHFESICYLISDELMKTDSAYIFPKLTTQYIEANEFDSSTSIAIYMHLNNCNKQNNQNRTTK